MNDYSVAKKNTLKVYQDIHIAYDGFDLKKYAEWLPLFLRLPKDYFANRICLDAGCGGTARGIYALLYNGAKFVYGVDFSKRLLEIASSRLKEFRGRFELIEKDILKFDNFGGKKQVFDFIYCEGVLHHTTDPEKGFSNLVFLLKPGGMIYIMVYRKTLGIRSTIEIPLLRLLRRLIPYKWVKNFVNRTKIGQSIYSSILDDMYVPIRKTYRPKEIIDWYKNQGLINIRVLKKYDPSKETTFYKKLKGHLFLLRGQLRRGGGSIRIIGEKPPI